MSEPVVLGIIAGLASLLAAAVTAWFANRRHRADTRELVDGAMQDLLDRFQGLVREQDERLEEQDAHIRGQDREISRLRALIAVCYEDWRTFALRALARLRPYDADAAEALHAELPRRPAIEPPAPQGA